MADNREKHPFDDESDWCEVCTYFSGEHAEHTLTPIQWTVVDHLLGLSTDEPYSDDYLADQIVPAILKAFKEIHYSKLAFGCEFAIMDPYRRQGGNRRLRRSESPKMTGRVAETRRPGRFCSSLK